MTRQQTLPTHLQSCSLSKESVKVVTRYVIIKYKAVLYIFKEIINGKLPDITIPEILYKDGNDEYKVEVFISK